MTKPATSDDILNAVAELRSELDRSSAPDNDGYAGHLGINRCKTRQPLTRMCFGVPTVMMTITGRKIVSIENDTYQLSPGDMLMLPEEVDFDVENIPDEKLGRYLGVAIRFDAQTLSIFRDIYGAQFDNWDLTPRWHVAGSAKIIAATASWISWIRRFPTDQTQVRHRMIELMLLLASQGVAGNLIFQLDNSWRLRVKQLLLFDPARAWRIVDICQNLAVSESTLRRHLKEEGVGFRAMLEEVRLEHGMGLVMSTDMLISQISFSCGYQSQSRFSERFRKRFSMSPLELRNSRNAPEGGGKVVPLNLTVSGD
jgi:AraC-like DNA-binding protein